MSIQNQDDQILASKVDAEQEEKELERKSSAQEKHNLKGWLTSVLRRASFRWGPRSEAMRRARIERGLYKCAMCKDNFKNKEIIIDHIDPVVSIEGFKFLEDGKTPDWNVFITRLFCDVDGFQILCKTCSDAKTSIEDTLRAQKNQARKLLAKEKLKNERKSQKLHIKT